MKSTETKQIATGQTQTPQIETIQINTGLIKTNSTSAGTFSKAFVRTFALVLALILTACTFAGCGNEHTYDPNENTETKKVTDDAGRTVEVASEITKIAPSGATTTALLISLAPEMLVGLDSSPSRDQREYLPEYLWYLPTFGQFYGSKSTLNMEALINEEPQLIIDTGDRKLTIESDMDYIQEQTGIPTVYFEADLQHMADAYRKLGQVLGKEEEAEELARFIEKTIDMANEKSTLIAEEDKLTVMYGTGATGLSVNAEGSSQSQVIEAIGAFNAVVPEVVTSKGGGTILSMEGVYDIEPDIIVFAEGGPYDEVETSEWSELKAVKEGKYYEIPGNPYCWLSSPSSVNMIIGIWWLGQIVYPEIYNDYDIIEVAQEYYSLFWHYDLTEDEARQMLSRSIYK